MIDTAEKRFGSDIEACFVTVELEYIKATDKNDQKPGVCTGSLASFIGRIWPKAVF